MRVKVQTLAILYKKQGVSIYIETQITRHIHGIKGSFFKSYHHRILSRTRIQLQNSYKNIEDSL